MASENWKEFFPFKCDEKFDMDSSDSAFNGEGKVLKLNANVLELSVDVSALLIPGFEGKILIEYRQEGSGNRVLIKERGEQPIENEDAEIASDLSNKTRKISAGQYSLELTKVGAKEAKLVVRKNSRSMRLKLSKR
jgi:hypothetical protein